MPSKKVRQVKTRRARAANVAIGMSIFWAISAYGFFGSGGRNNTGLYLVLFTVATLGAWAWAITKIRADQAAGKTLAELQALSPDEFEDWVARRFKDMGYSVKTTGTGGDHGVDLIAEKAGEVAVVQCKNYKSRSVGEPVLRDLYGAMHHYEGNKAFLVTTGQLTQAAGKWAEEKPLEVWDADKVVEISAQFGKKSAQKPAAPSVQPSVAPASDAGAVEVPEPAPPTSATCPRCGSPLVERRNKTTGDRFLGCSTYPRCRYTQPL